LFYLNFLSKFYKLFFQICELKITNSDLNSHNPRKHKMDHNISPTYCSFLFNIVPPLQRFLALNGKIIMNAEMRWIWREVVTASLTYCPSIHLDRLHKTTEYLSQDSWHLGQKSRTIFKKISSTITNHLIVNFRHAFIFRSITQSKDSYPVALQCVLCGLCAFL
jgi:hypothetical protein